MHGGSVVLNNYFGSGCAPGLQALKIRDYAHIKTQFLAMHFIQINSTAMGFS